MLRLILLIITVFISLHICQYEDESHLKAQAILCHSGAIQANTKLLFTEGNLNDIPSTSP